MRIGLITSGAAGMFCGSCMKDNTLAAALSELGHDALLIPTFTPIRTDEIDVSEGQVFYGGINVFLEQKSWLFRHTPRWVDWLLNRPWMLRLATRRSVNSDYADLADLTLSMLRGTHGHQKKEAEKLIGWLRDEVKPDVLLLTNALLSGIVPEVKRQLGIPVLTTLQGDDVFLDALPTDARRVCLDEICRNDRATDGYISTSRDYADHMAGYLGVSRDKVHVVHPGINLKGHGGPRPERAGEPPVVGYFARICPEKGFHNAVDAFIYMRNNPSSPPAKLRAAGWMGDHQRGFFEQQVKKLADAGLAGDFERVECPDHASKVRFLQSIDVFSVPADFREPKGLYVLEAWANGVPVVQPRHGSFPELIDATGGGLLVEPGDTPGLAAAIRRLLDDPAQRADLGRKGQDAVRQRFTARVMAEETAGVLSRYVAASPVPPAAASVS
jgi:glycosyltransferase involved in cell wall biosynthesis